MTGTCPKCGEIKEITDQGMSSGKCDDCYTKQYTCVVCNEMVTKAWDLYTVVGKGNGHKECFDHTKM